MVIGASTSNFYPALLEDALDTVLSLGFRDTEVFFNAASELEVSFVNELRRKVDDAGTRVHAVHPHTSFMEPHFLFSPYARRADEMLDNYKRTFDAAARLGADFLVLHGDRLGGALSTEQSIERYERLYDLGVTYGVRVAQENVVRFRSQDLDYIRALKAALGSKAAFVLDLKQTVRCGVSVEAVAAAMGDAIVHVHISDHDDRRDCLPPKKGTFDYNRLFSLLRDIHYNGAILIELYRHSFEDPQDLVASAEYLRTFLSDDADQKRQLFLTQKQTLDLFLQNGAITKAQYDKSLGDLKLKMNIKEDNQ